MRAFCRGYKAEIKTTVAAYNGPVFSVDRSTRVLNSVKRRGLTMPTDGVLPPQGMVAPRPRPDPKRRAALILRLS